MVRPAANETRHSPGAHWVDASSDDPMRDSDIADIDALAADDDSADEDTESDAER